MCPVRGPIGQGSSIAMPIKCMCLLDIGIEHEVRINNMQLTSGALKSQIFL